MRAGVERAVLDWAFAGFLVLTVTAPEGPTVFDWAVLAYIAAGLLHGELYLWRAQRGAPFKAAGYVTAILGWPVIFVVAVLITFRKGPP